MNFRLALKWLLLAALVFALVWITFQNAKLDFSAGLGVGNLAPKFKLRDVQGQWRESSEWNHKLWIVSFWATWCEPCVVEMPGMEALYQKYKEQGLVVLGINIEEEEALGKIQLFLERNKLNFPILRDPYSEVARQFGVVSSIPHNFIIDQHGKTVLDEQGPREWNSPKTEALIQKLLQHTH